MKDNTKAYAEEFVQEHGVEKLLLVVASNQAFVGKFTCLPDQSLSQSVIGCEIVLVNAVEMTKFMTQAGLAIQGTLIGDVAFDCEDLVVCELDSKSMYYAEYYRVTSDINVVSSIPKSQKHN